jgi:hypothetical protein
MRTRFIADLNPAYPSKGEKRWAVFQCGCPFNERLPRSFAARESAERHACALMVEHALAELGIIVQSDKSPQC